MSSTKYFSSHLSPLFSTDSHFSQIVCKKTSCWSSVTYIQRHTNSIGFILQLELCFSVVLVAVILLVAEALL